MFDTFHVPSFGGGLNFAANPLTLRDDEWTWARGWLAKDGYAEVLPTYEQVKTAGWSGITLNPIGLFQNIFSYSDAILVVGTRSSDSTLKLYKITPAGSVTAITWDAVGTAPSGDPTCVAHAPFLDGYMVFNGGVGSTAVGVMRWNGGATFSGISTAPQAYYLTSFSGRLVAGWNALTQAGVRTVSISDANSTTVWTPAISNSADSFVLDDAESGVNGFGSAATALAVFTRGKIYGLAATGGIPPLTRQVLLQRGSLDYSIPTADWSLPGNGALIGETPYGLMYRGTDDFYFLGGDSGVGRKIYQYYRTQELTSTAGQMPFLLWHATRGAVIVSVPLVFSEATLVPEILLFDPATGAWSRRDLPIGVEPVRHGMVWDTTASGNIARQRHCFINADESIYIESSTNTPVGTEWVWTKFFGFGSPIATSLVDRIKIDWEPLVNLSTDTLTIWGEPRNDLSRTLTGTSILGNPGLDTAYVGGLVLLGTLSAARSELSCRQIAKYHRFVFQATSGRPRIRGFSLHYQVQDDRTAP